VSPPTLAHARQPFLLASARTSATATLVSEPGHSPALRGPERRPLTRLLDQTLDEESNADKLPTKIATGGMFKAGVDQQARN